MFILTIVPGMEWALFFYAMPLIVLLTGWLLFEGFIFIYDKVVNLK